MIEVLKSAFMNGAMKVQEEVIALEKLRGGDNPAAIKPKICIRTNTRLDHPGNMWEAGLKELDYLVAGDCGIKGKVTVIKYVPDLSENHIIESSGKHLFMYQIYTADNDGKNSAKVSNADNAGPIFDRSKIAEEILTFQIHERKKARGNRRRVYA